MKHGRGSVKLLAKARQAWTGRFNTQLMGCNFWTPLHSMSLPLLRECVKRAGAADYSAIAAQLADGAFGGRSDHNAQILLRTLPVHMRRGCSPTATCPSLPQRLRNQPGAITRSKVQLASPMQQTHSTSVRAPLPLEQRVLARCSCPHGHNHAPVDELAGPSMSHVR